MIDHLKKQISDFETNKQSDNCDNNLNEEIMMLKDQIKHLQIKNNEYDSNYSNNEEKLQINGEKNRLGNE